MQGHGMPEDTAARADGFDADWLAMREPADHAARDRAGVERALPERALTRAVDLGGGTGSTLRYLIPRLGGRQQWWLLDHDPALLAAAGPAFQRWGAAEGWQVDLPDDRIRVRRGDVFAEIRLRSFDLSLFGRPDQAAAQALTRMMDGATGAAAGGVFVPGPADTRRSGPIDLVTASALLDLVGRRWIEQVLDWCLALRADWLFALTYDGRVAWQPELADDAAVRQAFDGDQRRDKGFGAALGPDAVAALRDAAEARRFRTTEARSDWVLQGPGARAMQERLASDYAAVASAVASASASATAPTSASALDAARIAEWLARRRAALATGGGSLVVGHHDLVGRPPA